VYIGTSRLTQTEVFAQVGITQPRISDFMRDKREEFSLEMLITLEAHAGRTVTLELT
jgi:predicted XRE-type DNA-binding protein